jgi:hypothetical protein
MAWAGRRGLLLWASRGLPRETSTTLENVVQRRPAFALVEPKPTGWRDRFRADVRGRARIVGADVPGALEPWRRRKHAAVDNCVFNADMAKKKLELLGLAEVAVLLGMRRSAVVERRRADATRRERSGWDLPAFPEPVAELACGPIWLKEQFTRYVEADRLGSHGRFKRYMDKKYPRSARK